MNASTLSDVLSEARKQLSSLFPDGDLSLFDTMIYELPMFLFEDKK